MLLFYTLIRLRQKRNKLCCRKQIQICCRFTKHTREHLRCVGVYSLKSLAAGDKNRAVSGT